MSRVSNTRCPHRAFSEVLLPVKLNRKMLHPEVRQGLTTVFYTTRVFHSALAATGQPTEPCQPPAGTSCPPQEPQRHHSGGSSGDCPGRRGAAPPGTGPLAGRGCFLLHNRAVTFCSNSFLLYSSWGFPGTKSCQASSISVSCSEERHSSVPRPSGTRAPRGRRAGWVPAFPVALGTPPLSALLWI